MKTETAILVIKKEKGKLTKLIKDCWNYCDEETKSNFNFINKHNYIEQTNESFLKTWGEKLNLIGIDNIVKFEMNDTWDMGYIIYKKPIDEDENKKLEEKLKNNIVITEILTKENIKRVNQDKMIMQQRRIERLTIMGGELRTPNKPW